MPTRACWWVSRDAFLDLGAWVPQAKELFFHTAEAWANAQDSQRTAMGSDTQWIPGVSGMQTFIFYKPWHSMRRTLPMSGWKWCGVRKPIVAAVGSAVAQAAPWSCLLAAPTCSFLVWERNPLSLLHWHYFGYPKSGSCSSEAQVHPCAAGQQCHLGTLPRTGRFAKIRDSVHIFILPQYHWVYATQENFLKPELPTVLPQLGVRL